MSVHSLCEYSWVLDRRYGADRTRIGASIRILVDTSNVVVNRPAVEAGLIVLDAGGDFADGVIAFDGRWLGGETFISFDEKAVKLLTIKGPRSVFPREPLHYRRGAAITARLVPS